MAISLTVPAIERESVNGIQEVSLLTNAFTNRKIFLFGEINAEIWEEMTLRPRIPLLYAAIRQHTRYCRCRFVPAGLSEEAKNPLHAEIWSLMTTFERKK